MSLPAKRPGVRGCLVPIKDETTLVVKLGAFALYNANISIDEPAPPDPFALPLKHVADLQLFDCGSTAIQRIKLAGQVLHERDGEFYIAEGTNGLRFIPKTRISAKVGDEVEVVGFPQLDGPSPVLREAMARKTGTSALPQPYCLSGAQLLDGRLDSRLVQLTSRLVTQRAEQVDQLMELQSGSLMFLARLPNRLGRLPEFVRGSRLRLTGVYAGQGGDRTAGRDIASFELLLNSSTDVAVIERPSWWTAQHAVAVAGALTANLVLAGAWITALRRRVEQRTCELKKEIELHEHAEGRLAKQAGLLADEIRERTQIEAALRDKKALLETEIEERKRAEYQVELTHKQLLATSRQAGMAEIATSVLHNVGNVLNSVNVSATLLAERLASSGAERVRRIAALLDEHQHNLHHFLTHDPRTPQLRSYVALLADKLANEQSSALSEVKSLRENVDHIKKIVVMQQDYAKSAGITELVNPSEILEDALRMNSTAFSAHQITVLKEYEGEIPPITVDKHKALQILINLISNAKHACDSSQRSDKQIHLRLYRTEATIRIIVSDNGVGIPAENLTRIFNHGFTTRRDGRGFGLHSGALAANELGGTLTAQSDGPGQGATFTLEIPRNPAPLRPHDRTPSPEID